MTPLSFRAGLTLRWTFSLGAILLVSGYGVWFAFARAAREDLDLALTTLAATELASSTDGATGAHLHVFPTEALGRAPFRNKWTQMIGPEDQVRLASAGLEGRPPLMAPVLLAAARAGGAPVADTTLDGQGLRAIGLRVGGDVPGLVLVTAIETGPLDLALDRLARILSGIGALSLVATALAGYVLATRTLRPVERITARAAEIARGDFSAQLDPPLRDDEIGRMTQHLNSMLKALRGALEANRRFAADASHELRSPLARLRAEVDVVLRREREQAEYRGTLLSVREETDRMTDLVTALLTLVRAQEGGQEVELHERELAPLVAEALATVTGPARERDIEIDLRPLGDLRVVVDDRLFPRALENLVRNAVEHNRPGGRVEISGAAAEPGRVRLRIRDTGPGIPLGDVERIFERFERLDSSRSRATGGFGLGLAICREVVELCGGSVRVAETSPAGTTFELDLPGGGKPG